MIKGEEETREKLALCARALGRIGAIGLGGHITLRIPDSELIVITPGGGLDKEKLTAADMVTMDADGKYVSGPYGPPLEWPIHTAVHRARPELDSVAHLHAHWSTVFAISDRPMEPVLLSAASRIGEHVPFFEIPSLVTTADLGEQLKNALGDAGAILMRWHGSTVVGRTIDEMFDRAWVIEENARLFWEANAIGNIVPVPRGVTREAPGGAARTLNYYANLERPAGYQRHQGSNPAG